MDGVVSIDGNEQEWQGHLTPLGKEKITLGLRNDETYLYVSFLVNDRVRQMQIMAQGMTVWFDPSGGKEKTFGVRFPVGLRGGGSFGTRILLDSPEEREAQVAAAMRELELVFAEGKSTRYPVDGLPGVEVAADFARGGVVYELKIPLQVTGAFPYAVGAAPGTLVGIGFETPEVDREAMRAQMGERSGGGGIGGGDFGGRGGGMGPAGSGGFPGGDGPGVRGGQRPDPLKVWTRVQLAGGN